MADDDRPFYAVCACCGAELTIKEWPPIVVEEKGADGDTLLYSFCNEGCKKSWADST